MASWYNPRLDDEPPPVLRCTAGLTAATRLARVRAQSSTPPLKTVRTAVLEIGYHKSGTADAFPVVLLHGFPNDAHAYDGVLPLLAEAGYRVFAVYLCGHGATRFLDPAAPRTAEQAAIGQDVIDFADALKLPRVAVADKRIIEGAGHFLPHEQPEPVARAIVDLLRVAK